MSSRRRWVLWLVLLAGAGALFLFDSPTPQVKGIVDAAAPKAASERATVAPAGEASRGANDAMILAIRPRPSPGEVADAFAVRDWTPPPPPPPKPAAPPPPSAPPFPYAFFGKKLEDGAWQVFLRRDERILVVKTLDTIDDQYRVDEIRPPVMTVTYLPLSQQQSVPIGGEQ